jgi:hypothetical protein
MSRLLPQRLCLSVIFPSWSLVASRPLPSRRLPAYASALRVAICRVVWLWSCPPAGLLGGVATVLSRIGIYYVVWWQAGAVLRGSVGPL